MNNIIRQWIRQAQAGDGEAVLAILQVFRPLLYKYARKYRYCYGGPFDGPSGRTGMYLFV